MNDDIDRITTPYYIVNSESVPDLINEVNRFIQAGWRPLGGVSAVSMSSRPNQIRFIQALTKSGTQI